MQAGIPAGLPCVWQTTPLDIQPEMPLVALSWPVLKVACELLAGKRMHP